MSRLIVWLLFIIFMLLLITACNQVYLEHNVVTRVDISNSNDYKYMYTMQNGVEIFSNDTLYVGDLIKVSKR